MSSTHFTDTVTMVPADWANDVNTLTYGVFGGAQNVAQAITALGLSWVAQNNLQATITGGSIDNTPIGQVTPAKGTFTVLKGTIQGTGANDVALVPFVTSAVATLQATLGSMASQNANAVAITGGAINATTIGLSTPAAAAFTTASVSAAPVNGPDVANKTYVDSRIGALPNFGTMAIQNANAITVTGGSIDNTVIGGATPAEAYFTTVNANQLAGPYGYLWLDSGLNGYYNYGAVLHASTNAPNAAIVLGASGVFQIGTSPTAPLLILDAAGRLVLNTTNDTLNQLQVVGGARIDKILLSTAITLPNQAATKQYVDTGLANVVANVGGQISAAIGQLGSMAHQNSNAVAITGGTIDGVAIGSTTPATGAFTTVTAQTVGSNTGSILFNQTSNAQAIVLNASTPTKPNIEAWINQAGAFRVLNGTTVIAQIMSSGRSLFGSGAVDDGQSILMVAGQATVTGQLLLPQLPGSANAAANKAYVDEQIATVQGSTVTPEWVNNQIAAAIAPLASTTYVDNAVAGLVNAAYVNSAITNALTPYATQTYVNNQITSALTPYATQTYVNNQITNALANYATQAYVTSALSGYATQSYVTSALTGYVTQTNLGSSTGAYGVGYNASTVGATLDALTSATGTTQNANTVYAGPTTGAAATPTFRSLVNADLPAIMSVTTSVTAPTITATTNISAPGATFTGTGAVTLPASTTTNRPGTPSPGMARLNTTLGAFEIYTGTTWASYIGSSGGTITGILNVAALNVTSSLTVTNGTAIASAIPGVLLQVSTTAGSSGDAHILLDGYSSDPSVATATSYSGRSARGTAATPVALAAGDMINGISGYGYGATAFPGASTVAMHFIADGAFTDTSMPSAIAFLVTPASSIVKAEAARINNAGHLLVGQTADNGTDLVQVNGNVGSKGAVPLTDQTYDIGTGTRQWRNIYQHGFEANTASVQVVPTTGNTVTVTPTTNLLMVDPAGTLAALTISLPSFGVAADGQYLEISFSQAITALTWSLASGTMQNGAPASITAGQGVRLRYNLAINQWRMV